VKVLLDTPAIAQRVHELGVQLTRDYRGRRPVLIGLLKGSFVFLADLIRQIDLPLEIDFLALASYRAGTTPGELRVLKDVGTDVEGRDVLIVEDICDTGHSLAAACRLLAGRRPASLRVCILLDKPSRRQVAFQPDYVGFEIPDRFVVGYGLDRAECHRNLPYIAVVEEPGQGQAG
jgi:hypoxanthine phosphoribosyltransferase